MSVAAELGIVFVAGLVTGLATGLGVLPFFLVRELPDRSLVACWGVASGVLFGAATVGLIGEGLASGATWHVVAGCLLGAAFVFAIEVALPDDGASLDPGAVVDSRTVVLTILVLTLHSVPEGVAIGVAFADPGHDLGFQVGEVAVSTLAVTITVAIAIVNVPEGLAIAIPLIAYGMDRWRVVGWAVVSGLPQPIGAVVAFGITASVASLLPVSFGFAAGALLYLIAVQYLPAGAAAGAALPRGGRVELVAGAVAGAVTMSALLLAIG